jgi:DNA repair ATPase RecN
MDKVQQLIEAEEMMYEAEDYLQSASDFLAVAKLEAEEDSWLLAGLGLDHAIEDARRAMGIYMTFAGKEFQGQQLAEEIKAELEQEMALIVAAEDLLSASQAAAKYLSDVPLDDELTSVLAQLFDAIERARPV